MNIIGSIYARLVLQLYPNVSNSHIHRHRGLLLTMTLCLDYS